MTYQTAEETEKNNIEKMGEALGKQYSALWQAVAEVHINWKEYTDLFGTRPERVDLLNKAAGGFFRMTQDGVLELTLLHIARLTDPPYSVGRREKTNLTIQNLPELIRHKGIRKRVRKLIETAKKETEFCKDWRHRRIAHIDLKLALGDEGAEPLAEASRAQIKKALKSLEDVLNVVETHYLGGGTVFSYGSRLTGAMALLRVLHAGVKVKEERAARLEKGEFREDDRDPDDL